MRPEYRDIFAAGTAAARQGPKVACRLARSVSAILGAALWAIPPALLALGGCERFLGPPGQPAQPPPALPAPAPRAVPLPLQQVRAYPELASGAYRTLADFEDAPGVQTGRSQVDGFRMVPVDDANARRYVVHVTRTGVGAMEAVLPPQSALVFADLPIRDFRPYTLLSMAVHSQTVRDDLQVVLGSQKGSRILPCVLLRPGWNTVLVDIQHLAEDPGFDAAAVKTIGLALADATGPERLYLDDVLLVENSRLIQPAPEGLRLSRAGTDWRLDLRGRRQALAMAQSAEGLWRLGADQPLMQLAAPGKEADGNGEDLSLMGERRRGEVELLEHNEVRVRLASTWYFPARGGEWATLAVRRIRWEYTFYGDGRCVVHVDLNNAGGEAIGAGRLLLPEEAAWPGLRQPSRGKVLKDVGTAGRWCCLLAPEGDNRQAVLAAYSSPPTLDVAAAGAGPPADGDADRDGFDEGQGCYFLRAKAGLCRFTVPARTPPLLNPAFRVRGPWKGQVHVSADGAAIRDVAVLEDGSAIFQLRGRIERPAAVEVAGEAG